MFRALECIGRNPCIPYGYAGANTRKLSGGQTGAPYLWAMGHDVEGDAPRIQVERWFFFGADQDELA